MHGSIAEFIVWCLMIFGFTRIIAAMKSPGGQQVGGMVAEGLVKKFLK